MISRVWVFRCDDCGKVQMVYTATRSVAVQAAQHEKWAVTGKMCYCHDCSLKRSGRTL